MGYHITKPHLKHTSFDGPMSVDRQQRNISTPQHEISFHRVQRLQKTKNTPFNLYSLQHRSRKFYQ
jgi:hypothetical protein